jgi:hypothetical protein
MLDKRSADSSSPLVDGASTTADTARADDDGMASAATAARNAAARSHNPQSRVAHTDAEGDQQRTLRRMIDMLDANGLALVIALAYARLGRGDRRHVQRADVELLRRLARQAHDLDASLIEHRDERRRVGERRGAISPEAANTAGWANRLADALDALLDGIPSESLPREDRS